MEHCSVSAVDENIDQTNTLYIHKSNTGKMLMKIMIIMNSVGVMNIRFTALPALPNK